MTAAMALLVGPTGHVVGVDKVVELVQASLGSVAVSNPELLGGVGQQQEEVEGGHQVTVSGNGKPRVAFVHGNALAGTAGSAGWFDVGRLGNAVGRVFHEGTR